MHATGKRYHELSVSTLYYTQTKLEIMVIEEAPAVAMPFHNVTSKLQDDWDLRCSTPLRSCQDATWLYGTSRAR